MAVLLRQSLMLSIIIPEKNVLEYNTLKKQKYVMDIVIGEEDD